MSVTPLVIVGAGGHGREVHDVVEAVNEEALSSGGPRFDFLGFLDDQSVDLDLIEDRGPYLGAIDVLDHLQDGVQYVIGIGSGSARRKIDERAGYRQAAVLIHPTAAVGRHRVTLRAGTVICSNCSVTTNITIGRHTHLNLNVTVAHDSVLGDYVTVNPGATISGNVTLEDEVSIGTGASIIQGRTVGQGTIIGAGASVVRDMPAGIVAVGVPAKPNA